MVEIKDGNYLNTWAQATELLSISAKYFDNVS